MCRSVYLPRSAVRPTISGRVSAELHQRVAERAPAWCAGPRRRARRSSPRWSGAASPSWPPSRCSRQPAASYFERLMRSSRRRGSSSACCHSCGSTRRKWFFSRSSRNGTPLAILVSQMMTRGFGSASARAASKAATSASMSLPSTRCTCQPNASNFGASGSKFEHLARRAVGLLVVDVDDADQVVELAVAGRHRRLPGRALVELAVGEQVVDEARPTSCASARGHADGDRRARGRASRR